MMKIDDITLIAYVDGELGPDKCAEVEAAMAEDADIRATSKRLRESTALLRIAYNDALQMPDNAVGMIPTLASSAPVAAPAAPRPGHTFRGVMAIAASLLIFVLGGGGGYMLADFQNDRERQRIAEARALDKQSMQTAFAEALERHASGKTVHWENPLTGSQGEITPVSTHRKPDGSFCRRFETERVVNNKTRKDRGVACRNSSGQWRIKARYF